MKGVLRTKVLSSVEIVSKGIKVLFYSVTKIRSWISMNEAIDFYGDAEEVFPLSFLFLRGDCIYPLVLFSLNPLVLVLLAIDFLRALLFPDWPPGVL